MVMKIDRSIPWCNWREHAPADKKELIGLPSEVLLSDIVGIKIPNGCNTVREAYDTLNARGEIFLDGQVLMNLVAKGHTKRTPLWRNPEFSYLSYAIFAGVVVKFCAPNGVWYNSFPVLYFHNDSPELTMFGWEDRLDGLRFTGKYKSFFAVKYREKGR